jgi:hypothetical protein
LAPSGGALAWSDADLVPAAPAVVVEVDGFSGAAVVPLSPVFDDVAGCAALPADGLVFCFVGRVAGAVVLCARAAKGNCRQTAASARKRRMRALSNWSEARRR